MTMVYPFNNQNTQNFYILVGDVIWIRQGANSGSTGSNGLNSNSFEATPSQWQIRCTFLYY